MVEPVAPMIALACGDATAEIALRGAEPVSWRVAGRDLVWRGDPAHWAFHAPFLFPVVGASRDGAVRVDGTSYPMPQHGFARTLPFRVVRQEAQSALMRLEDGPETRAHYPFDFRLDIGFKLEPTRLVIDVEVVNTGSVAMPYGFGFHPAFPWPVPGASDRAGHRVVFAAPERPEVPEIAPGGLLARRSRSVPLQGRALPLAPELFTEALVFLDARSRSFVFEGPDGQAITFEVEGLPHLAVWTRPDAPFLSLEAWSGHADWEDAAGELAERASMTVLAPDAAGRHAARWSWRPAP